MAQALETENEKNRGEKITEFDEVGLPVHFEIWNLESEIWNLKSGIWNLESGIWNLESGIWDLESGIVNRALNPPATAGGSDSLLRCFLPFEHAQHAIRDHKSA